MHWHITCATVLQLFSHVCTDSHHCASSTGVFTQTLRNAVSNAFCCFPGKDFYKKRAQHEGGSRCRLALHNPLQFLAYGGWFKKKMDLNGVKIYSSWTTENKLFIFGHMLCVALAVPACAVMKECFTQAVQIRASLCAGFLHVREQRF